MKWMEMIQVRSSAQSVEVIKQYLSVHMPSFRGVRYVEHALVLTHAPYEEDLAVMFVWNVEREPEKTREGQFLAHYFTQYGIVHHAIWTVAQDALGSVQYLKSSAPTPEKEPAP